MATMKTLNGYGFNATELNGKTAAEIMLTLYPVGAVYISVNSTSPASLFGGTWEQLQDRFLLAAGSTYSAGSTGGEATHTLTVDEMPSHSHTINRYTSSVGSTGTGFSREQNVAISKDNQYGPHSTGGDLPHNNMPPYLAVYMWKRVS